MRTQLQNTEQSLVRAGFAPHPAQPSAAQSTPKRTATSPSSPSSLEIWSPAFLKGRPSALGFASNRASKRAGRACMYQTGATTAEIRMQIIYSIAVRSQPRCQQTSLTTGGPSAASSGQRTMLRGRGELPLVPDHPPREPNLHLHGFLHAWGHVDVLDLIAQAPDAPVV